MKSEYCTHVFIDLLANVSNWTFVSNWPLRMCTVRAKWDAERENTYGRPKPHNLLSNLLICFCMRPKTLKNHTETGSKNFVADCNGMGSECGIKCSF